MIPNAGSPREQQDFIPLAASLQSLLDDFATFTGISLVIMDSSGKPVTKQTVPHSRLCMELIKGSERGRQICQACDAEWGRAAAKDQTYKVYSCRNGLVDFVSPILYEGEVWGYLFGGQLRIDDKDLPESEPLDGKPLTIEEIDAKLARGELISPPHCWHQQHAEQLGIDSTEYLSALSNVRKMPARNIEAAARVLCSIANNISATIAKMADHHGAEEFVRAMRGERAAEAEFRDELRWAATSRRVAHELLDELRGIAPYKTASVQLILGDTRTLLAGFGFNSEAVDRRLLKPVSKDPLVREIVERREPLILSNTKADPRWTTDASNPIESWVGLPVVHEGVVIGLFTMDHDRPGSFSQGLAGELIRFATQVAPRMWHARLWNSAERLLRDMQIVTEVANLIGAKLDTDELLRTIVEQIAGKLQCSHCTIFFPEGEGDNRLLVPRVTYPERGTPMTRRFRLDEGLAGLVYTSGESLVLSDGSQHPRFVRSRVPSREPRSMLVAPIRVGNQTLGVISADQDAAGWFSESDRRLVDALSQQAGIAIQRSLAVSELLRIAEQIVRSEKADDILREVAIGAVRLTGASAGVIYLLREDGQAVERTYKTSEICHPPPRLENAAGLTRTVMQTGKALTVPDVRKDPRVNAELWPLFHSLLAAPLMLNDRVVGVLFVDDQKPHDFSQAEVSLVTTFTAHAAVALYKAELLRIHSTLEDVMQKLVTQDLTLKDALQTVAEGVREILGKDVTPTINPYSADTESFGECHAYGPLAEELNEPPRATGGTARYVLQTGEPLYLEDVEKPPEGKPTIRESSKALGIRSFAAIPIKSRSSIVAVMFINSQVSIRFGEGIQRTLGLLASQAGVAIEIALLHETAFYASLMKAADLGYLAGCMGHELITPLTEICLLTEKLETQVSKKALPLVHQLGERAKQATELFDAFRAFQKTQSMEGPPGPVDLSKLIGDVVNMLDQKAKDHKVLLTTDLRQVPQPRIDGSWLQSIVINLVKNAIEAVDGRADAKVRVLLQPAGNREFEIVVQDNGQGVSKENRKRIFFPYFTTKGPRNMGIGLFWVQRVVRKLNGTIHVEDAPGGGAAFRVTLPLTAEKEYEQKATAGRG